MGSTVIGQNRTEAGKAVSRLQITIDESYHGRQCMCKASHKASPNGVYGTESVEFNVIYPPKENITLSPSGTYTVFSGRTVTVDCQIKGGNPLATLTWECKETSMDGQNVTTDGIASSRLTVRIDKSYHGQQCVCTATHQASPNGVYVTESVEFNVIYPPKENITLSPSGTYTVFTGGTETFDCQIKGGNPLATLSWHCMGSTVIGQNRTEAGKAVSRLQITIDESYHGRQCMCKASHKASPNGVYGTESVEFNVIYPPKENITLSPSGTYTVFSGRTVTVDCQIKGGNPLATLTWECKETSMDGQNVTTDGIASSRLTVRIDKSYHGQQCVCTATHQASPNGVYVTESVEFNVIYPPKENITLSPSGTYTVLTGGTVTVDCQIKGGNPLATLSWHCMGSTVIGQNRTEAGKAVSRLQITIDESYHGRQCMCKTRHKASPNGVYGTESVEFNVIYPPSKLMLIRPSGRKTVRSGANQTIDCLVKGGNPLATISWQCKGSLAIGKNLSNNDVSASRLKVTIDKSYHKKAVCVLPDTKPVMIKCLVQRL
ncbi:nephrin-like [Pecten maximus]|uniref:nephrin-like n=1 Tax=Pecten maximus TaxID=6579 RepID=UPI00145816E3|nr:nephrin-like [Pecten maximus]